MSVKTRAVGVVVDADDLAAEALAIQIRTEAQETTAITRCPHGDYIVMPYTEWEAIRDTASAQGSELVKVCYAD